MSGPASSRSPRTLTASGRAHRRRERGGVSWVSLVMLALVVGGAYWAWVWVPVYVDHYAAKQVVVDFMNQAIKNQNDAILRQGLVYKLAQVSHVTAVDERGKLVSVPAIQVDERDLTWERDVGAKSLHVAFEYQREVVYPFIERTTIATFAIDRTGDLTVPDWGPTR